MTKIRVGVLGATGYAGAELVRILLSHPGVQITTLASKSFSGKPFSQVYPHIKSVLDMELVDLDIEKVVALCDVVFTALPHGASKDVIPLLYARGLKVIDLSGDFRYNDAAVYEKWYGESHHAAHLLDASVYGLPELYREKIKTAQLIGSPGCYTTASILALYPLLAGGYCDKNNIIVDAKSGVSGAGRSASLDYMFCECTENVKAYKIATHRHTSEIEQELSLAAGSEVLISFTPHLIPMKRGIYATCYANLSQNYSTDQLTEIYRNFYNNEYFIRVCDGTPPQSNHVAGSNFVDISVNVDPRLGRAVICCTLDNLIKGAGGQAVQSMNILFGLDEKTGLGTPGLYL